MEANSLEDEEEKNEDYLIKFVLLQMVAFLSLSLHGLQVEYPKIC